jgi:fluoride exporter
MLNSIALISVGAAAGAVLRGCLGLGIKSLFPALPLGTRAANLIGSYSVGIVMESPSAPLGMAPEFRPLGAASDSNGLSRGIRSNCKQRGGSC